MIKFDDILLSISFDYYDGAEGGIVVLRSGAGFKFSAVAQSKFGCFRCFLFSPLRGDWRVKIDSLSEVQRSLSAGEILFVPDCESEALREIESEAERSGDVEIFGIGKPSFEWMKFSKISVGELEELNSIKDDVKRYKFLHNITKYKLSNLQL